MDNEKLLQNTLAEATTEMGFPAKTNTPLQKEVTLEDGTVVTVEGITPNKMKTVLNQNVDGTEEAVTFKTPGEVYKNEEVELPGVCQVYNSSIIEPDNIVSIAVTTEPTKTTYAIGDTFDPTGLVVTATFNSGKTEVLDNSELTFNPDTETQLTAEDTSVTINYYELSCTQAITIE